MLEFSGCSEWALWGNFTEDTGSLLCLHCSAASNSPFPCCCCLARTAFALSHGFDYIWFKKGYVRMPFGRKKNSKSFPFNESNEKTGNIPSQGGSMVKH